LIQQTYLYLTANCEDFFIQQNLYSLLQAVHMLSQIQALLFWLENHQLNMYIVIFGQKIACIVEQCEKPIVVIFLNQNIFTLAKHLADYKIKSNIHNGYL
jgi:hypothetical protein